MNRILLAIVYMTIAVAAYAVSAPIVASVLTMAGTSCTSGLVTTTCDFGRQASSGLVACPSCGSTSVDKRPMAPAVVSSDRGDPTSRREVLARMREWAAGARDVGDRFAEEARRIHGSDGVSGDRRIRGRATRDEIDSLAEDGIPFGVLPSFDEGTH